MSSITIENIYKTYGDHLVIENLSALIPSGHVVAVTGPSGAGKTTLLRLIMGLEKPDVGKILIKEDALISVVFQEERLCENLSAYANIALVSKKSKSEIISAMERVGLGDVGNKPVREFSGGMRQRVSILRGLLADYHILLLDEPFKEIDEEVKGKVIKETLKRIQGKTVILVSHDPSDAKALEAESFIELK